MSTPITFQRPPPPGSTPEEIQAVWDRSDAYHNSFLIPSDPTLDSVLTASHEAGLPDISVSPAQGKFFGLIARVMGARRILEVGTLGGYSTIWFARALPFTTTSGVQPKVVTLEYKPLHAETAAANIARVGLSDKVDIMTGPAVDSLKILDDERIKAQAEGKEWTPFDLVFLDADKKGSSVYYDYAKKLTRSGAVIICDNAVYNGLIADTSFTDGWSSGVREMLADMKNDGAAVDATTIGTAGERGYDGFVFCVKN